MANAPIFEGFSSVNGLQTLYDINLINQDILNNINTRRGERVMAPEYGSIIWDLLFENKSPLIISQIQDDLIQIVANEPRVQLMQIQILEQEHGYIGVVDLYYTNLKTADQLKIDFNANLTSANIMTTGT